MSIYDSLYNLINQYVFGNSIASGSPQELATTLVALICCIFLIALPFLVVWKVIQVVVGR